ncbi:MAG: hypothetical protein J6Z36_00985 [Clostridia bacterium]|nr:hypothetical protein [Clostridia bacterium]
MGEEGGGDTITVKAGETFTWKAEEIGELILENSDKPYNRIYTNNYQNGKFKEGYSEYQFVDIVAEHEGRKVGYGALTFYLAAFYADDLYILRTEIFTPFLLPKKTKSGAPDRVAPLLKCQKSIMLYTCPARLGQSRVRLSSLSSPLFQAMQT